MKKLLAKLLMGPLKVRQKILSITKERLKARKILPCWNKVVTLNYKGILLIADSSYLFPFGVKYNKSGFTNKIVYIIHVLTIFAGVYHEMWHAIFSLSLGRPYGLNLYLCINTANNLVVETLRQHGIEEFDEYILEQRDLVFTTATYVVAMPSSAKNTFSYALMGFAPFIGWILLVAFSLYLSAQMSILGIMLLTYSIAFYKNGFDLSYKDSKMVIEYFGLEDYKNTLLKYILRYNET